MIVVLILLVQFRFSSQQANISHSVSGSITTMIINTLKPVVSHIRDTPKWLLEDELENLIRKVAHFFLFFTLGISLLTVLKLYLSFLKKPLIWLLTLALVVLFAGIDEWHQSFIPGREARFTDVIIDVVGALFAFLCMGVHFALNRFSEFLHRHFLSHK